MHEFHTRPPPLIRDAFGVICVKGTRVQLEILAKAWNAGATLEEIVQRSPSLDLRDVYAVISYVLDNQGAVNEYVCERRAWAAALKAEIEAKLPPEGIRSRLLARCSPSST